MTFSSLFHFISTLNIGARWISLNICHSILHVFLPSYDKYRKFFIISIKLSVPHRKYEKYLNLLKNFLSLISKKIPVHVHEYFHFPNYISRDFAQFIPIGMFEQSSLEHSQTLIFIEFVIIVIRLKKAK